MNRTTLKATPVGGYRFHVVTLGTETFVFTTFKEALGFIYNIRGV